MKLSILTIGSRGDVQPYVALGVGLRAAGHEVCLLTHERFRSFVTDHGLKFTPIAGDPQELQKSEATQKFLASGNKIAAARAFFNEIAKWAVPTAQAAQESCRDAHAVIVASPAYFYGEALKEALRKPLIVLSIYPMAPTVEFAGPLASPFPGWLRFWERRGGLYWQQRLLLDGQAWMFKSQTNGYRSEVFGLPKRKRGFGLKTFSETGDLWLYGYSPHVVPKPADWSSRQHVVGWWFLDDAPRWTPPPALIDFLNSGPPPMYVGFGSMYTSNKEQLSRSVIEAIQQTNQRAVIARGWGALESDQLPDSCFVIDEAPHDWLFPRMSTVVHHGGSGSTGAGLRAGIPNIVVPFGVDQHFWGRHVHANGVGPAPIPALQLTTENFAAAIRYTLDPQVRQRAAALGEKIRSETGVQTAVELIERELAAVSDLQTSAVHGSSTARSAALV